MAVVAAVALILLVTWAAPVVLEPLFNRARPLDDPHLAVQLSDLADEAGVPVREVLVIDASRRTRKLNAYVSGLGSTRRVVLFDTLAADAPPAEVKLVVAHESLAIAARATSRRAPRSGSPARPRSSSRCGRGRNARPQRQAQRPR